MSLNKMMRKAACSAIELIRRGIATKAPCQFGCNKNRKGTSTHPFSSLCSDFHNDGHKDTHFLVKPVIDFSSIIIKGNDAMCLFREMVRLQPQPSVDEFTKLLSFTANKKHYSVALLMFEELRRLGVPIINEHMMNIAIHCCCCLEHEIDSGFALLGSFFKCGYEPGPETLNYLIKRLFSNNKVDEVVKLVKKLLILKLCKPDHAMIHIVINGLHERGHNRFIGQLLGLLEETSYQVYDYCDAIYRLLSLIDKQVDDALQLLSDVIVRGISPCILTFDGVYHVVVGCDENSLIKKWVPHKKYLKEVALEVFSRSLSWEESNKMGGDGKVMSVLDFLIFQNCNQSIDQRKNVFDDSTICDALINGYCLLGQLEKAKEIFDTIMKMGYKPSIFSYCGLIIENCRQGNVNEAWNLFLQVPCNDLEHTRITYNSMLYVLFREGRFDDGWKLFEEMVDDGRIKPDLYTYVILIYGLCKNREVSEAFSFLGKLEEDEGINLDVESYEILIEVLCQDGKPDAARHVLNQLPSKDVSPSKTMYNMIMDSLCREGFEEEAKCLFMEVFKNHTKVQDKIYSMHVEWRDNTIDRFFKEMEMDRKGFSADDSLHS